jgi:hypothetical protein
MGAARSTSPPNKGMQPSQGSSWPVAVTSLFRSTWRLQMDMWISRDVIADISSQQTADIRDDEITLDDLSELTRTESSLGTNWL